MKQRVRPLLLFKKQGAVAQRVGSNTFVLTNSGKGQDGLALSAPLVSSLTLLRGLGTYDFTGQAANDVATVKDFEGLAHPVLAGESRFQGVRRVENLIPTSSTDLTKDFANWTVSTVNTDNIVFSASVNSRAYTPSLPFIVGRTYTMSAKVHCLSGTEVFRFKAHSVSPDITVTTTPTRVSWTVTPAGATAENFVIQNGIDGVARTVYFDEIQIEDVTGQTTQTPGEYVSVGVGTGSELVANGDFSNGTTGWSCDIGTLSEISGIGRLTSDGVGTPRAGVVVTTTVGKVYAVRADYVNSSVLLCKFRIGTTPYGLEIDLQATANEDYLYVFRATTTTTYITARANTVGSPGDYIEFDNFSLKEIDHGSNADGVKYFDTHNINTVSGNIVTEATGSKFGRRVENYVSDSEDVNAASTPINLQATGISSIVSNGVTLESLEANSTGSANRRLQYNITKAQLTARPGNRLAVQFRCAPGTKDWVRITITDLGGTSHHSYFDSSTGAFGIVAGSIVDYGSQLLDNGTYLVTLILPISTGSTDPIVYLCPADGNGTSTTTAASIGEVLIYCGAVMFECVADNVAVPSEYVSTGVLSHPYSGTGLDGVAEVATTSPYKITANVLTKDATTYPRTPGDGILIEGARTNNEQDCNDLSAGTGVGTPVATLSADNGSFYGPDNLHGVVGTGDVNSYWGTVTRTGLAAGVTTFTAFIETDTAATSRLRVQLGSTGSHSVNIDFSTSPPTLSGLSGTSIVAGSDFIEHYKDNIYRVGFSATCGAADTAQFRLYADTTSGTGITNWGGLQIELGAFHSSLILSSGGAQARTGETLRYDNANLPDEPYVWLANRLQHSIAANEAFFGTGTFGSANYMHNQLLGSAIRCYRKNGKTTGSDFVQVLHGVSQGDRTHTAFKAELNLISACANGGAVTSEIQDGASNNGTDLYIGNAAGGIAFGLTKDVKIYDKALDDAEMQELTS